MSDVSMSEVVGIVAVGRNGVIGSGGDIPWRIPEDWRRFKALTMGHVLVMGRKTFDSIGRPLPGRTTIVITRDAAWRADGVAVAGSVGAALDLAESLGSGTIFVAGGGEIYRAAWERLDRLEVTEVDLEPPGQVTFPEIDRDEWREVAREPHSRFSFVTYLRVRLDKIAARPINEEIVARLRAKERSNGPTTDEIVAAAQADRR